MTKELKRTVGIYMPLRDKQVIELEAAERDVSMGQLVLMYLEPHLKELRKKHRHRLPGEK